MSKAVIKLCVYAGTLERCRFIFFSFFFFRFFFCACAGQGEKKIKNFEQVPGRADRNCGEWIALFFFFGWSLGTRARRSSKKLWRVDRTSLSLLCLFSVSSLSLLCLFSVSSLSLLCLFSVSSLSLLCLFAFVLSLSLPLPSTLFFSDPNFGQVLGRAYRNCGESTALFFFSGLNFEHVLGRAYRDCGERERER